MRGLIFLCVYVLFFAYPPLRLIHTLAPDVAHHTIVLAFAFSGPALLWLSYQWRRNRVTRICARAAYAWVGVAFISLAITLPWELVVALFGIAPPWSGFVLGATITLVTLWSVYNAQTLSTKTIEVSSERLAAPMRLVHISDVHIGSRSPAFLKRVIAQVNRLEPDAVAVTGDLVDFHGITEADLQPFAELKAPSYFCIGNHERYIDCDDICERLKNHGVTVLRNAAVANNTVRWVGIDDADSRTQVSKVLPTIGLAEGPFTILLYHRPDDFEAAVEGGVDLMLCGHTHNGQIAPFGFLVKKRFPRIVGLHQHLAGLLYVSPGTGTWGPPLRLGSVNEITVLELEPAPPAI
jgi:uncharacterized protein